MNIERTRHHTSWAGALAVAAELSRKGYDATITFGNTPSLDLLCCSPQGVPFKIQVKSLTNPNAVPIQKRLMEATPQNDLLFIIALVSNRLDGAFRFFVMTHAEVVDAWNNSPKTKKNGEPYKPGYEGLTWGLVKPHEGK